MANWSQFPRLTGLQGKVVLAGDSVLDNFHWLANPRRNLRVVVEEELGKDSETKDLICLNMAVDQMSSFDFIERSPQKNAWYRYQWSREEEHKNHPEDDPLDKDGYKHLVDPKSKCVKSVENIKRLKNVKYIFLSVGGNDVYLHADIQTGLIKSLIPGFGSYRTDIGNAFYERLSKIVKALKENIPGAVIVPVLVYHPHHEFSISGIPRNSTLGCVAGSIQKNFLSRMVTPMVQKVLEIASVEGLHVVDLSQTLDPFNERHYGNMDKMLPMWSGAEPSDVSQNFIAKLIQHVVAQHEAGHTTPTLYHASTSGDSFKSIHARPITPTVLATYRFHHGPGPEKVETKNGGEKKCKC
eukprot:TRINITY_DN3214_c0_g5_i1.p1 TRINITY_DN3214_c0_g5~~TRINITY_DN3214_c0_g5_i1.p1  ORF type:complete len:373 (+),score=64.78 TRINITY_DN3214_c0_g5_i1:59-1120(+)